MQIYPKLVAAAVGSLFCLSLLVILVWLYKSMAHLKIKLKEEVVARKQADHSLAASEAKLKEALRLAHVVNDLNGKTTELLEANVKLQGIDRLKSMFIASISHELRTPLNSIIGYSTIVLDEWLGPLNEEQKAKLAIVLRAGKHLLAVINDVIDLSRVEAGKIESSKEEFNIADLVGEALELLKKEIQDKGLGLDVEVGEVKLYADRRRLFQCLMNLLSNAVKFTEQGRVTIKTILLTGKETRIGSDCLQIIVKDTGIGIAKEDQPRLFSAFSRIDSPLREQAKGTGLGLYLVKKITEEIFKGEVGVESTYGNGSTFFITIPMLTKTRG